MNLRGIANQMTRSINPNVTATVRVSTGYTRSDDFKQVPAYAPATTATVQMQALSKKEIEHLDSLNLSSATAALYCDIQLTGIDRTKGSGGDLVMIGGDTWLVIAVLEGWTQAGWCKVAIARQMPT